MPLETFAERVCGVAVRPRQREVLALMEEHRLLVAALGRRSGKSLMSSLAGLHNVTMRPDLDAMVRPGERRYALVVATSQRQAALVIDAARSLIEQSAALAPLLARDTEDELSFELPSGARTALRAVPCSSRGVRGWPVSLLVMDEAAHFVDGTDGPATADRVYEAMAPALAQFGEHGRIIVASTPYGDSNLFARLFRDAQAGKLPGAVAMQATTEEMGGADAAFLALERQRDPGSFESEYEAKFLASGDSFIDLARVVDGEDVAPREAGRSWVLGLDPAFAAKGDDFGVALVGESVAVRGELVVGPVLAIRPAGSFIDTLDEIAEIGAAYGARAVTDQYSAEGVIDHLRRRGLAVRKHAMSATSKTDVFSELRARLYDKTLKLPQDPELRAELGRLQTRFRAGSAAVLNPRSGSSHGDRAQALALAVFEHKRASGVLSVNSVGGGGQPTIGRGDLTLRGRKYLDQGRGGQLVLPPNYERRERTR